MTAISCEKEGRSFYFPYNSVQNQQINHIHNAFYHTNHSFRTNPSGSPFGVVNRFQFLLLLPYYISFGIICKVRNSVFTK